MAAWGDAMPRPHLSFQVRFQARIQAEGDPAFALPDTLERGCYTVPWWIGEGIAPATAGDAMLPAGD
jgi:hypothetical protein